MLSISTPPAPPTPSLNIDKRLSLYKQMLDDLEAKFSYQEQAISYHTETLKLLEADSKNTKAELEACRKIIASLTADVDIQSLSKSNGNKSKLTQKISKNTKADKSSKKPRKTRKTSKTKASAKTTAKATKKVSAKSGRSSKLPPSSVIDKYRSITDMVLDFVSKQEGVVSVSEVIKYAYPKGLKTADKKKVASSFSSVLGLQARKGILERTIPGKYLWRNN